MELITSALQHLDSVAELILLKIDRLQLAKRRWRGVAEDGTEFGFDLEHPLHNGDAFFVTESQVYVIEQQAEPVIDIALPHAPTAAARIGWLLGNLHFSMELHVGHIRVNDDAAIRLLLEREHISYELTEGIFHPLSGAHSHAH